MKAFVLSIVLALLLASCSKPLSEKEIEKYTIQGAEIAQATQKTLGANLMQKMKKGGVIEAIAFCNTMALPLTDKMSGKYNATIKRTSHKIRSEKNKPSEAELKIIKKYQDLKANKEALKPIVTIGEKEEVYF